MKISYILCVATVLLGSKSFAQSASLKINEIPTNDDTTISIKKGSHIEEQKSLYEIVSGSDEISSDDEYDDKKALAGWKQACAEWKKELKELNAESAIVSISCGHKVKDVEKSKTTYRSLATYKIKVKIKESK